MQLGLGWIFVGADAVENGRSIDIALLRATSLYSHRKSRLAVTLPLG